MDGRGGPESSPPRRARTRGMCLGSPGCAQVLWDTLCTFSCHLGATSVIIRNCSLALAPVKPADRERLTGMLSYVEAIPMDVLEAGVPWTWETFPEYMSAIGQRLGVNVGTLVGHSAVRLYAMGKDCSERPATDAELEMMRRGGAEGPESGAPPASAP